MLAAAPGGKCPTLASAEGLLAAKPDVVIFALCGFVRAAKLDPQPGPTSQPPAFTPGYPPPCPICRVSEGWALASLTRQDIPRAARELRGAAAAAAAIVQLRASGTALFVMDGNALVNRSAPP